MGSDAPQPELARQVRAVATRTSAEVNVLGVVDGTEDSLFVLADSDTGGVEIEDVQSVAQTALATRRTARATEPTRLGRQALVAEPLIEGGRVRGVAVFADELTDVQANVSLVRRRILVGGAIAFLIAVLGGYLVARALSLRIERLERAARKVASGDFSDRIEPDSDDELGQLGAAFDDMQRQLQRLDHARKQFIAQASHELRTPLFSLGGFLELLEDEELDEATRRAVPRPRARAGRAPEPARHRAARPLAARSRRARAAHRADRRAPAGARCRRRVHARWPLSRAPSCGSTSAATRSRSSATRSGSRRWFVSCSTTLCCIRPREPGSSFRPRARTGR